MFFASDNAGPVHPRVMESLIAANQGHAAPYGDDEITTRVRDRIREIFEAPEAAVYLVGTGTAANSLALALLAKPWEAIFCHRESHIQEDECGAPEFMTGGSKLSLLDGPSARISPESLATTLQETAEKGVHGVQRGPLSITQVTELGTVYTLDEIRTLTTLARQYDLPVHMDGARFANALVALGCTPAEMTWKSGIDILSFGGTKNGLMGVEAVVIFDPANAWEFELRRKRAAHLFSKHRYLAAQMEAYLEGDLWLDLARKANDAAARLEKGISALPDGAINHPRHANMLFASWPRNGHRVAIDAGAQYYFWPFEQSLDGPDDETLQATEKS
ncbi:MAG: beta-eliminating lyase-related protein [Paracoccaceae bacterium]|nr:beta-eliminating lyase-related protein [Paracoccaceae bacterium]